MRGRKVGNLELALLIVLNASGDVSNGLSGAQIQGPLDWSSHLNNSMSWQCSVLKQKIHSRVASPAGHDS
jgi:hypothetical protein